MPPRPALARLLPAAFAVATFAAWGQPVAVDVDGSALSTESERSDFLRTGRY